MNEQDIKKDNIPLPSDETVFAPEESEQQHVPLNRHDTEVLLLLTILADICLYGAPGGTGAAILLLATAIMLPILRRLRIPAWPLKAGAIILALAVMLIWSAWWLAIIISVVAIFLFAVHLWKAEWNFLESLFAIIGSVLCGPFRLLDHITAFRKSLQKPGQRTMSTKVIIIPVIVSVMFLIIFSLANPVVGRELSRQWQNIVDFLSNIHDLLNIPRFFFWCGWLIVFSALIRPVIRFMAIDQLRELDICLKPDEQTEQGDDSFLAAYVTLVCVNVIFLGYNCMDAVYLYFKAALPAGITWTSYTHSGCAWLTFGLFLSTVVLGVIFRDKLNFHSRNRHLKILAYIWTVQNVILAIGTLRRIYMYIDFSGLTHLLLTGVYGALLVMSGLAIMAVKVRRNHNSYWLLQRYIVAFATGLTILSLTPHGWVCAAYNAPRILQEKPHATWPVCLKELQADALPPLIPLLDYRRKDCDAGKEKLVREGIAAILGQHLLRLEKEEANPWTQWQASSWWALKHLRPAREKIYATVPPEQWEKARNRLKSDYDLNGYPSVDTW